MRLVAAAIVFGLLAALILTLIPAPAKGECYPTVTRSRVVSYDYTPVVVKKEKVVVTAIADPVLLAIPTPAYFAAYFPPAPVAPVAPTPPGPPAPSSEMSEILRLLQGFDSRLKALEAKVGGVPPAPLPPPKPDPFAPKDVKAPSGLNVIQAKCASCHEARVSAEKGGSLTLLDGLALAAISERDKRRVMAASYAGRMPPKTSGIPPLTDDEVGSIVALLDR